MTTSHECLHQLAFNLGVQTRTGDAPSWVAEGLATFFETVTYAALTEVGKKNRERLDMFRRLVEANQVITIRLLIGDDAFFNPSHPASLAAYAETWGLTHFLLNCYEKEYMKYLQKLRDKKVCEVRNGQLRPLRPPVGPEERLKDFRDSFGKEIPLLEKEWIDYMLKM
jgi:hypothetical protein